MPMADCHGGPRFGGEFMAFHLDFIRPLLGLIGMMAFCWVLSEDRRRFPWLLCLGGLALQVAAVIVFFASPATGAILGGAQAAVEGLAGATQAGSRFVFGYLAGGAQPFPVENAPGVFVFAFQVLPVILVVSSLSALLWHIGLLNLLIRAFGLVFQRTLGLGGASAIAVAANIFLGMVEAPLIIRGYLERFSRSELFLLMVVGLATVAGSTMAAYAALLAPTLPNAAGHILAASLMSAPAGVLLARIVIPEQPGQGGARATYDATLRYDSAGDALLRGVSDGLTIALNVGATLLVLVALVALCDLLLAGLGPIGGEVLSVKRVLAWLFWPVAWSMGVADADLATSAQLLGVRMALTEFLAYADLANLPVTAIEPRTRVILTYGLCGFANFGSVGILAAGMTTLVPSRRKEILELSWKALIPGFLASCMTGAIVAALPQAVYAAPH